MVNISRLIFIVGIDGSGKSFFTEQLISELRKRQIPAVHLWSRFNNITSKPLLGLCRLLGLNYYEKHHGVLIGYHDFEKSKFISGLFVVFQIIDLWLVTVFRLWPKMLGKKVLLCDRGAYDTLIDVMVDTKNRLLVNSFIGRAFVLPLPRNHKVFLLQRDPEKIFTSRQDVKIDKNFGLRYDLYRECAKTFGWTVIENNGTPEDTLRNLLSQLSFQ